MRWWWWWKRGCDLPPSSSQIRTEGEWRGEAGGGGGSGAADLPFLPPSSSQIRPEGKAAASSGGVALPSAAVESGREEASGGGAAPFIGMAMR